MLHVGFRAAFSFFPGHEILIQDEGSWRLLSDELSGWEISHVLLYEILENWRIDKWKVNAVYFCETVQHYNKHFTFNVLLRQITRNKILFETNNLCYLCNYMIQKLHCTKKKITYRLDLVSTTKFLLKWLTMQRMQRMFDFRYQKQNRRMVKFVTLEM